MGKADILEIRRNYQLVWIIKHILTRGNTIEKGENAVWSQIINGQPSKASFYSDLKAAENHERFFVCGVTHENCAAETSCLGWIKRKYKGKGQWRSYCNNLDRIQQELTTKVVTTAEVSKSPLGFGSASSLQKNQVSDANRKALKKQEGCHFLHNFSFFKIKSSHLFLIMLFRLRGRGNHLGLVYPLHS